MLYRPDVQAFVASRSIRPQFQITVAWVFESAVESTNRTSSCHSYEGPFPDQLEKELELRRSYNESDFYQIQCIKCHATHNQYDRSLCIQLLQKVKMDDTS